MPDNRTPQRLSRADPQITAFPHISAPIDEAPLFPKPPMRLRDKAMVAAGLTLFACVVLAFAFFRATALR